MVNRRLNGDLQCPGPHLKGWSCIRNAQSAQTYLNKHKPSAIKRILAWLAERLYDPNPQDDETHAATRYAMMDKGADK